MCLKKMCEADGEEKNYKCDYQYLKKKSYITFMP